MERLVINAPMTALIMAPCSILELGLTRRFSPRTFGGDFPFIPTILSCLITLPCNWTALAVIGNLSAITFQVAGNVKSIGLVLLSMIAEPGGNNSGLFDSPRHLFGAVLAIASSVPYSMIDFETATWDSVVLRPWKRSLACAMALLVVAACECECRDPEGTRAAHCDRLMRAGLARSGILWRWP
jgi:hypothetical protein